MATGRSQSSLDNLLLGLPEVPPAMADPACPWADKAKTLRDCDQAVLVYPLPTRATDLDALSIGLLASVSSPKLRANANFLGKHESYKCDHEKDSHTRLTPKTMFTTSPNKHANICKATWLADGWPEGGEAAAMLHLNTSGIKILPASNAKVAHVLQLKGTATRPRATFKEHARYGVASPLRDMDTAELSTAQGS